MLKMFHYIRDKWYYIVLIILLLLIQAYCDLSLPDYTSKIVNIGIQQKGIEDCVPEQISEASMNILLSYLGEEEQAEVTGHYELANGVYTLSGISGQQRERLSGLLGVPILASTGYSLAEAQAMPESIINQTAILYLQQEYTSLGIDLDDMQTDYVISSGLRMLGLALVIMLAAICVTFLSCQLAAYLGRNLRNQVYRKVISFSSAEMDQFSTASLITRSTNDIQQVQMLFTMVFRIVLYAPILGIGGVLKVLQTDASMTWILALAVLLIMGFVTFLFRLTMPKFSKLQKYIDNLNLVTREILTGIPVIRAFSTEKHEEERFEDANRTLTRTNLFVNRCMTFMMPTMMLIMNGVTVLIIYNGSYAVDNGTMQVGNIMAFMQYAMQIIMSFLMLTMMSIMIPRANVSAIRINEVLSSESTIHNPSAPKRPETGMEGLVEFRDVSFSYPGADEAVLSNISFRARRGETVAFIGSTGSGKSTLVNLIPRFFDVTAGQVLVDGIDVREMDLKELRGKLGYVPQKGVLFSGTIDSNLRYGREEATEEEVAEAARVAQAWDFIQEKQEGLTSYIAQGGSNVSGGQKQRLSIARAIARDPEIYIFDDSFSALDYKTDVILRKALKQHTQNATTLIVAQRISTILHADTIIVLDEGRIAGQGSHKELLASCDVYKQIAMSQLSEEELAHE